LDGNGTFDGIHDACEFDQRPVAHTIRPLCSVILGPMSSHRWAWRRASVPASSRAMRRL
jgi:hypothetical protein